MKRKLHKKSQQKQVFKIALLRATVKMNSKTGNGQGVETLSEKVGNCRKMSEILKLPRLGEREENFGNKEKFLYNKLILFQNNLCFRLQQNIM